MESLVTNGLLRGKEKTNVQRTVQKQGIAEFSVKTLMVSQLWPSKIQRKIGAFSILLADIDTCDKNTVKDWKVELRKESMDLWQKTFLQKCA